MRQVESCHPFRKHRHISTVQLELLQTWLLLGGSPGRTHLVVLLGIGESEPVGNLDCDH